MTLEWERLKVLIQILELIISRPMSRHTFTVKSQCQVEQILCLVVPVTSIILYVSEFVHGCTYIVIYTKPCTQTCMPACRPHTHIILYIYCMCYACTTCKPHAHILRPCILCLYTAHCMTNMLSVCTYTNHTCTIMYVYTHTHTTYSTQLVCILLLHARAHTYEHAHVHRHTQKHTETRTRTPMHTHPCTKRCMQAHAHTHVHVHFV